MLQIISEATGFCLMTQHACQWLLCFQHSQFAAEHWATFAEAVHGIMRPGNNMLQASTSDSLNPSSGRSLLRLVLQFCNYLSDYTLVSTL